MNNAVPGSSCFISHSKGLQSGVLPRQRTAHRVHVALLWFLPPRLVSQVDQEALHTGNCRRKQWEGGVQHHATPRDLDQPPRALESRVQQVPDAPPPRIKTLALGAPRVSARR